MNSSPSPASSPSKTRRLLVGIALVAVAGGATWFAMRRGNDVASCEIKLSREDFTTSIRLGTEFMLAHQTKEGRFDYEYDWRAASYSEDDNEVRQAGALWGLGLLYQDEPSIPLKDGLDRGFAFFDEHATEGPEGVRCIAYPGSRAGGLGTVALVALAHLEVLRAPGDGFDAAATERLRQHLKGLLAHLVASLDDQGLFHGKYEPSNCRPHGKPSPYSDGEALLALVKAAKYEGRDDLIPILRRAADAGYVLNVAQALDEHPDSDTTKGYYQWSSMAFFELATSGWPDTEKYGDYVLELADWMIDVHRTLKRTKNTGYAYEGILHAYELARQRGDEARMRKYACVIDRGLGKLLSWQIGHPLGNEIVRTAKPDDRAALGGIQNDATSPGLRIDVTQHQMHAAILARRYAYP